MDALWADPAVIGGAGDRDARADNGGEGGEYDEDDEEQEVPALERLEAVSRHSTPTRFSLTASPEVTGAGRERSAEGIPRPRTGGPGARGMHDGAQAQRGDGAVKVHPRTRALRASHHRRWASFDGSNALNWDGEDISRAHSAENSARLPWGGAAEQHLPSSLLPDSLLREPSASAVGAGCPKPSVRRTRTRQQRQPRASASSQLQVRSRTDRLGGSGNQSDGEVDGGGALAGEGSSDDDELFRPTPRRVLGGVGARSGKWASARSGERGSVLAAWQQRELAQVEEKLRHAGDGGETAEGALAEESQRRGGAQDGALASEMLTRGRSDDAEVDARENGLCGGGDEGRGRGEHGEEGDDGEEGEESGEGRGGEEDVEGREAGGERLVEGAAEQEEAEAEKQKGGDAEEERGLGDREELEGKDTGGGSRVDGAEGEGESEARTAEEHKAEEGEEHEQGGHGEGGWPKFLRRNATAHAGTSKGESGGSRLGQLLRNGTFKRAQGEGEERHGSRLARVATAVRAGLKSSSSFNARKHAQQHPPEQRQQQQQQQEQQQEGKGFEGLAPPKRVQFQISELEFATDGFARENILGQGGFGTVYRGLLPVAPREEVAVKVLKQLGVQADEEFHIELELLSRLDHKNLVRLHGFCSTATQRMLVYEYLPNGSLTDHLHGRSYTPPLHVPSCTSL
ncbi:unnamed protein product, partial [Closterium sp. Yama58-4]